MSQFQTTQVWETLTWHKIVCRPVLATSGVLLSLERSESVAQRCVGLIESKHDTHFLLRAKPAPFPIYQHSSTTCSEHNCHVLYIFHSLFG